MATYIVLTSFTDQGVRSVKDTAKRADGGRKAGKEIQRNREGVFLDAREL